MAIETVAHKGNAASVETRTEQARNRAADLAPLLRPSMQTARYHFVRLQTA